MDIKFSEELKARLLKAGSAEEIEEILTADGNEVTKEEAERIFSELEKHSIGREVSEDEMEAVSGGAYNEGIAFNRDWATEGCAATVEVGSFCWSNDKCLVVVNNYVNPPSRTPCPSCGGQMYTYEKTGAGARAKFYHRCISCGAELITGR